MVWNATDCIWDSDGYLQTTSALEARLQQLEDTINSLTESLVDKQSTIDTLQQQVVIYREDFQSERQDRERAQSHIAQLQLQINEQRQSSSATETQVRLVHVRHSVLGYVQPIFILATV